MPDWRPGHFERMVPLGYKSSVESGEIQLKRPELWPLYGDLREVTQGALFSMARLKAMWNEAWKVWYPDGPESPKVTLLKVNAAKGDYWDVSGLNGVKYLYRAGKAYFAGERPEMTSDMHEKVEL